MLFNANIRVEVAGKVIETINAVSISNDVDQIGASCEVKLPMISRISHNGNSVTQQVLTEFKAGDRIIISAWYDNYPILEVFNGYIYDFIEGQPLTLRCLDHVYKLRIGQKSLSYKKTTLKKLCADIIAGTGVELFDTDFDFDLKDFSLSNMSPAAMLEHIKKELGIIVTLLGNKLYLNIASANFGETKLNTSVNVIDADLQKPDSVFRKFKVKAWVINDNGTKSAIEVGDKNGELREFFYYKVEKQAEKEKLANEAYLGIQQRHYEGKITTLLYPDTQLFNRVEYIDVNYPNRSGIYVVKGIDITLDTSGFKRELSLYWLRNL